MKSVICPYCQTELTGDFQPGDMIECESCKGLFQPLPEGVEAIRIRFNWMAGLTICAEVLFLFFSFNLVNLITAGLISGSFLFISARVPKGDIWAWREANACGILGIVRSGFLGFIQWKAYVDILMWKKLFPQSEVLSSDQFADALVIALVLHVIVVVGLIGAIVNVNKRSVKEWFLGASKNRSRLDQTINTDSGMRDTGFSSELRPMMVVAGTKLLVAYIMIGSVLSLIMFFVASAERDLVLVDVAARICVGASLRRMVMLLIIWKMFKGRNWARLFINLSIPIIVALSGMVAIVQQVSQSLGMARLNPVMLQYNWVFFTMSAICGIGSLYCLNYRTIRNWFHAPTRRKGSFHDSPWWVLVMLVLILGPALVFLKASVWPIPPTPQSSLVALRTFDVVGCLFLYVSSALAMFVMVFGETHTQDEAKIQEQKQILSPTQSETIGIRQSEHGSLKSLVDGFRDDDAPTRKMAAAASTTKETLHCNNLQREAGNTPEESSMQLDKSRDRFAPSIGSFLVGAVFLGLIGIIALGLFIAYRYQTSPRLGSVREVTLSGNITMRFRGCPAGSFMMGSPDWEDGRYDDETRHKVTLTHGFWIGETEVTQGQWKSLMNGETIYDLVRKGLRDDTEYNLGGKKQTWRDWQGLEADSDPETICGDLEWDTPVYYVSWNDACRFCARLTERERQAGRIPKGYEYRLPTEAEWEYACRAGTTTSLPNGKDMEILGKNNAPNLDSIAWYGGNSSVDFFGKGWNTSKWTEKQYPGGRAAARRVGQKAHNGFGLFDMIGNVQEWCLDKFSTYSTNTVVDPVVLPPDGSHRITRGGAWNQHPRWSRSAMRAGNHPSYRYNNLGFRVVLAPILN
jgi:formylglycine-generating enzyme required for sulfatase activity